VISPESYTENCIFKTDGDPIWLVEGFPVVLANCAQRDLKLNFRTLLSRHKSDSRKQQALEKLLLLSSALLAQQGLDKPENLESLSKSLKAKYGDLLAGDVVDLGNSDDQQRSYESRRSCTYQEVIGRISNARLPCMVRWVGVNMDM
jgi:hypothetical protein